MGMGLTEVKKNKKKHPVDMFGLFRVGDIILTFAAFALLLRVLNASPNVKLNCLPISLPVYLSLFPLFFSFFSQHAKVYSTRKPNLPR